VSSGFDAGAGAVIQPPRSVVGQFAVVVRVGKRGQPSHSGARAAYSAYCSVAAAPPLREGCPRFPQFG